MKEFVPAKIRRRYVRGKHADRRRVGMVSAQAMVALTEFLDAEWQAQIDYSERRFNIWRDYLGRKNPFA